MGTEILVMTAFAGGMLFFAGKRPRQEIISTRSFALWAAALFLAAFSLRLYIVRWGDSFSSDLSTFKAWGYALNHTNLNEIYFQDSSLYLDYPPGYLYVLLALEKLRVLLNIPYDAPVYDLMLKLPSLLTDLFCGAVLLWAGKRKLGEKTALLISGCYLFCPVILMNSAQWGQVDSFCTAILLSSLLLLYKEWYLPSALLYGLSIACKPQMLIFAPLYLFFTIQQRRWSKLPLGVLCAVGSILLIAFPFSKDFDFWWLLDKYRSTLDYYNYYSVNAYNLWTVLGWNWKTLPEGILLELLTYAAPVLATGACGVLVFRSRRKDVFFACPAMLMSVMFLLGIKMHERYSYPIFLFLLLAFLFTPDKRLLRAFAAVSATGYLNSAHVMYLFRNLGGNYDANAFSTRCMAALQTAALLYGIYVLFAVYLPADIKERPMRENRPWLMPKLQPSAMGRLDFLLVAVVTGLYCVAAFWNLGGTEMPLTSWAPDAGESVVLQADGECDALYYLPGLAPNRDRRAARVGANIQVESSMDGKTWQDCGILKDSGDYVFAWAKCFLAEPGKYIRLTALDGSAVLNEIGAKQYGKTLLAPLKAVDTAGAALTDEQNTVPLYTTYENSTYFDEIYHARTAYEHILGLEPYENTHPPLGKYIISLGILLFGMNPFGWRFMGTLFGVLMLPVLYHLLKQLFGRPYLCFAGTALFAFDFMHFTQTRIATIDTYAVFFLLLMYDAMAAFLRRDIRHDNMKKLLLPLLLSGIFTGLGIASKWTAAYGAVGLAVLFFGKLILSFRDEIRAGGDLALLKNRWLRLCLWCCLFFVAIPFALYFGAFLPLVTLPHNVSRLWESFISYQTTMFNYHSKLVAEHYFASPWYEWPFVVRPIWYFSGEPVDMAGHYSTISAMGNPLLWWACIPALFAAGVQWVRQRQTWAAVVLCGFCSVYLPWVLVPRLTFIYHYFTAVPFLVVALMGVFSKLPETRPGGHVLTAGRARITVSDLFLAVFTCCCLLLFFLYFPVISGAPTDKSCTDALRLFNTWYF